MTAKNPHWKVDSQHQAPFDPLLACLQVLAKLNNKPVSAKALISGLPLVNHKLTPEIFDRAAKRAQLSAQLIKFDLKKLKPNLIPAVLLLNNESACVVTKIINTSTLEVIFPETSEGTKEIALNEIENEYDGYAIFTSPIYQFDERAISPTKLKPKEWFWSVIAEQTSTYGEVILASLLINLFVIATPLFIMNVYDRVVPNQAFETLWTLAVGIFVIVIFEFILRTLRGYFLDSAAKKIDFSLSSKTFEHILDLKMSDRPRSVGAMANAVFAFGNFREFITSATISVLVDVPFSIIFLAVIWMIGGPLVLIPLLAIPLVLMVSLFLRVPLNKMVTESYMHSGEKQAVLIESLSQIETLKAFQVESNMQRRWEKINAAASLLGVKLHSLTNFATNISILFRHLATICVVIAGVYLIDDGVLTVGGLIACIILTRRAIAPVSQIAALVTRYRQSKTSLDGLDRIMKAKGERSDHDAFIHKPEIKGDIQFKGVSFSYPQQPILALDNVSLQIKAGERVGIIGRMGSGKSSLLKLIIKLYLPKSGSIILDGNEINQIDPAELRHIVGYIPQDVELFHGSIKDNVVIHAPYADDALITEAAKISGLNTIANLHPDGFDRQVGERGEELSGGQRQSVAITRALLLNPQLLLFDEPANSMDDTATKHLVNQLSDKLGNKTLIMITHKTSMLSLVDRLIVMDNGHIIADGSKEDILKSITEQKLKTTQSGAKTTHKRK